MAMISGQSENDVLLILDLDGTLIHEDGTNEDFSILTLLRQRGVEICLASRNDLYHVYNVLDSLNIRELFTYVVADFRPKGCQVRHIVSKYRNEGMMFRRVLFVDDFEQNVVSVKSLVDNVECLLFGQDLQSMNDILELIIN